MTEPVAGEPGPDGPRRTGRVQKRLALAVLLAILMMGSAVMVVAFFADHDPVPARRPSPSPHELGNSSLVEPSSPGGPAALLVVQEPKSATPFQRSSNEAPAVLLRFDEGHDEPTWRVELERKTGLATTLFHDDELAYASVDETLVAFDLVTGEKRWLTPMVGDPGICSTCFAVSGDVLLVQTSYMALHGIDRRTGKILWNRGGWRRFKLLQAGASTLIAGFDKDAIDHDSLRRIDIETGRELFNVPIGCETKTRPEPGEAVRPAFRLSAEGRELIAATDTCVQSFDTGSGALRWTVRGPEPSVPVMAPPHQERTAPRGVLLQESPAGTVVVYDRTVSLIDPGHTSLRPLWRTEGEVVPLGVHETSVVWMRLADDGPGGVTIEAQDILTGEQRWTAHTPFSDNTVEAGAMSAKDDVSVVAADAGSTITLAARSQPSAYPSLTVHSFDASTGEQLRSETILRPDEGEPTSPGEVSPGVTDATWSGDHVLIHTDSGAHLINLRTATALTVLPRW